MLMLAVILPATVIARPAAACGTSTMALAHCACCPKPARTRPATPPGTTLRDQCCALVPVAHVAPRPAAQTTPAFELPLTASVAAALPAPAARPVPPRVLAPPALDRSLFATRCALLL